MSVKMSAALPDADACGLGALADSLEMNPFQTILVIGVMVPSKRVADYDAPDDPTKHVLRFQSLEPLPQGSDMAASAQDLLEKVREQRTGVRGLWDE
jgi:hypothetical protein